MTRLTAGLAALAVLALPIAALSQEAAPQPAPAAAAPPAAAPPAGVSSVAIVPSGDLIDTLRASGQFTILLKALDGANLTTVLKGNGPITLLAPTDAAFQALPPAQLNSLMQPANAAQLQALLSYHLINAAVTPGKIQGTKGPVRTVSGANIDIDGTGAQTTFGDAVVLGYGAASNGDIYALNRVLTPPAPTAPAA